MSDQIATTQYPSLKMEYLEIIPNLSNRILYQEIPTDIPNLSLEEKANFLNTILKIFVEDTNLEETRFRIKYLDDDTHSQAFRALHQEFSWVQPNQYSLLALVNFVPQLFSAPTAATTRSSATETREALKNVIEKQEHRAFCDIMAAANPNDARESLDKFISLTQMISKSLFLSIAKTHQAFVLNYQVFLLEAGILALNSSYNELLLGISAKEGVLQQARELHQVRQLMNQAYIDYLSLHNPELDAFLKTIIPGLTFSNTFSFEEYKTQLLAGDFGQTWYHQRVPLPLSCPQLKELSESLDGTITKISAFKATEAQINEKNF